MDLKTKIGKIAEINYNLINLKVNENLNSGNHIKTNYDFLKNKIVVGCVGYARSGKDSIGSVMVKEYGFKRISYGDALKQDLDDYMKEQVFEDLKKHGIELPMEDIQFLNPKTIEIKEILRPYMVWYGEFMKKNNGIQYWVNRTHSQIGEAKKIIITDVRRVNELEPFFIETANKYNFESMLLHISQYGLTDRDTMTHDCIRVALENWLFEDTILIDSRIPDEGDNRQKHLQEHVDNLSERFPYFFGRETKTN